MDAIGGIEVIALVFGVVEAVKEFGVSGKGLRVVALVTGGLLVGIAQGISGGLIPTGWVSYIEWGAYSLAGGLAAMGYYDFIKRKVLKL